MVELYIIVTSPSHFAMLDEPFTHLNPIQIEKVKELLLEEKQNKGLLVTDHMYRHIIDICDNLTCISCKKENVCKGAGIWNVVSGRYLQQRSTC